MLIKDNSDRLKKSSLTTENTKLTEFFYYNQLPLWALCALLFQ